MIDKSTVCGSFGKAADLYDSLALFQRYLNEKMLCQLPEKMPEGFQPVRILDAGCGTGFGIQCLRNYWPDVHMTGCDISQDMVNAMHRKQLDAVVGDIEELPFESSSFNFVWSCLALQWTRLNAAFQEFFRVLEKDGFLYFATLAPGSLRELDKAFAGLDHSRHTLSFVPLDDVHATLTDVGFRKIELQQTTHQMFYPDFRAVIASIRDIGAGGVSNRRTALFGKRAWQTVQERYESFRSEVGLPVSYEVIVGSAVR